MLSVPGGHETHEKISTITGVTLSWPQELNKQITIAALIMDRW